MSEKKAKQERQDARKVVAEYKIELFGDGNVGITGNLDNLPMYFDVINRADRAVLDRFAKKLSQKQSNIVVPSLDTRGLKLV